MARNRVKWMTAGRDTLTLEWVEGALRVPELTVADAEQMGRAYVASLDPHERLAWVILAEWEANEARDIRLATALPRLTQSSPRPAFRIPQRILQAT